MRKPVLIFLFSIFALGNAFSQTPGTSCGQKEITERLYRQNPPLKNFQEQIEKNLRFFIQNKRADSSQIYQPNALVTLPVVVHIIHNNGSENISDAQVFTAIQHLNEAFANTGYYDPSDGVNTEIQFCLAQRDPNNNPTNGINRVQSTLTVMDGWNNGSQDMAVKNLSRWDPRCYINIWIVKEIIGPVAGYAYLPSAHGMNIDGIVGEAAYFGSSYPNDVLIIHEMGHYLGLYHTFQGGCKNDDCSKDGDQVCDTPPDQSTAGISCNSTVNSCSTDINSGFSVDVNDLHKDYLDYGNWNCMKVFTQGQADRMNWMIQNVRRSLLNCKSCLSPCPAPVTANFSSSANNITVGTTVNFTNSSINASGYRWYINNVLQATATNYSFTFNTAGTYIIQLSALTNNPLCDSAIKFDTIRVACPVNASFSPLNSGIFTNTTISFTNSSTGATTYQWYVNNVFQTATPSFSYSFSTTGLFTIKLVAGNGFCKDSVSGFVTVRDSCTPQLNYQRILKKAGDDLAFAVKTTRDGGSIIAGSAFITSAQFNDALLQKFDSDGNLEWSVGIGGNSNEQFFDVIELSNGDFAAVGETFSNIPAGAAFIARLSPAGNLIWSKPIYTGSSSGELGKSLFEAPDGSIIVAGAINNLAGVSDISLSRLSPTGNIIWSRSFNNGNEETANKVVVDGSTVFVVGSVVTGGWKRGLLMQLDLNGNHFSSTIYGNNNFNIEFTDLHLSGFSFAITGRANNNHFVARLNNTGSVSSSHMISAVMPDASTFNQAYMNADLSWVNVQSKFNGNEIRVQKIDSSGSILWARKFLRNSPINIRSISRISDNGFHAGGSTIGLSMDNEIFIARLDSIGCNGFPDQAEYSPLQLTAGNLGWTGLGITTSSISQNSLITNPPYSIENICSSIPCNTDPPGDTCFRSTFQKVYRSEEGLDLTTMQSTADGGIVLSGLARNRQFPQIDALVLRLNNKGDLSWSTAVTGYYASKFAQARETSDGGVIAVGWVHLTSSSRPIPLLVKFTSNGTVSWLKTYSSDIGDVLTSDVIELSNGQFALVGHNALSSTDAYGLLIVTDALGNMLMGKKYRIQSYTEFNSIVQTGDSLVVGGYYNSNSSHVGFLLSVNRTTGAVYKSVAFKMPGRSNTKNIVYKQPNGYFLSSFASSFQDFSDKNNLAIRFTHDFQLIEVFRKDQVDASIWSVVGPAHDSGYVIPSSTPNGFTLMTAGQNIIYMWGGIYGVAQGETEAINALALDDGQYMSGARFNMASGKHEIIIAKTNRQGKTPGCSGQPPMQSTTRVTLTVGQLQWNDISDYIDRPGNTLSYLPIPVPVTINTLCDRCDSIPVDTDTCNTQTFQKKIGGSGKDFGFDIKVANNNEYLVAGSTEDDAGSTGEEQALLMKLNNRGSIVWQKKWGQAGRDRFTKIVTSNNGEYYVFGDTRSQSNRNGSMLLGKFDAAGNNLWMREYNFTHNSLTGFENVASAIELPNGDLAFCANAPGINTDVGQPLPATYNIIGVLSNNGTIKWVKRFREYYIESGGPVVGISAINNALFVAASYGVIKLSMADGTLMGLQKKYLNLGGFISIEATGMKLMVYSNSHQLLIDENLNLIAAYRMAGPDVSYSWNNAGFSSETGSTIQGSNNSANNDNAVQLTRFPEAGKLNWSYRYPYPANEERQLWGSRNTLDGGTVAIGSLSKKINDNNNEPADIFVLRTDSQGRIPDCRRASTNITLETEQGQFVELVARNYPLITQTFTPTLPLQDANLGVQSLCNTDKCNLLDIHSKDTVCGFTDTVSIFATRDTACDGFTEWITDSSEVRIISSSDTLLKIQLRRTGTIRIYARIHAGCRLLSDSLTITVLRSPDSVNLGPNIQLCKISTYTFNAGSGFKTYLWQDGSTDSTLTIFNAGTYHVTATDYCGNSYRDTVIVSQAPDLPFDLGPDKELCSNDTIIITAPPGFVKYYWSPNYRINNLYTQSIRVSPQRDTTYIVVAEKAPGCLVSDSIRVKVNKADSLFIGNDTSFCQNDTITLTANPGFISYQWNTGNTNPSIEVFNKGRYWVKATNSKGCVSYDTLEIVNLYNLPLINLGNDFSICRDKIHVLDAGNHLAYQWQDGSSNRTFSASSPGTYWARVTNSNGCFASDTVKIISLLENPKGFLDSIADICVGQKLELKGAPGYREYLWYNNSRSSVITITSPGSYWLQVTNADGCIARDTILVKAKDCIKGVFFPNAFTPANGGGNNYFRPIVYGQLASFHLIVFNRWGQKVFETRDPSKGWDGRINGQLQDTQSFAWTATYQFSGTNEKKQIDKGTLVLVR